MTRNADLHLGPDLVLDRGSERLLRAGVEVPLRAKTFAVLCHLASHPGVLVSKEDLFSAVWKDTNVTDTVLAASISELRKALGEDPQQPRHIHTVHRRGYRFELAVVPDARASAAAQPRPGLPALSPAVSEMCGRDRELSVLRRELDAAVAGATRLVFVTCEPGGGKTTLVQAFLESVAGNPAGAAGVAEQAGNQPVVAIGQCMPDYGADEPFLPILEGLRRLLRSARGTPLRRALRAHASGWLAPLGEGEPAGSASLDRMLHELTEALEVFTAEHPLVLAIEDLHWSDPSTLALLRRLCMRAGSGRLLVLATYRPVDAILGNGSVGDLKRDVVFKRRGCEIALENLDVEMVEEFYARRYDNAALAAKLAAPVHARTEGIPLFLVALTDDLEARGIFRRDENGWHLAGTLAQVQASVPDGIREMIERRMTVLSPAERHVLQAAAAIGESFAVALVASALDLPLRAVDDCCVDLMRRHRFLAADGEAHWSHGATSARFRFVHRWYVSVLYEQLSGTHRRDLHAAIGRGLREAQAAGAEAAAAELALHFERAGDTLAAAQQRLAAGRAILRHTASEEAVANLQRGLDLLAGAATSDPTGELALDLRAYLAMALLLTRGYGRPEVGAAYESLLSLTPQGQDSPRRLQALTGLATFRFARGELAAAHRLMSEGVELGGRLGLPPYLYLGLALFKAETRLYQGQVEEADRLTTEALQDLAALQRPRTQPLWLVDPVVYAWIVASLTREVRGDHEGASLASALAVEQAERLQHPYSLVSALGFQCVWLGLSRNWTDIEAVGRRAMALADGNGFAHFCWASRVLLGRALAAREATAEEGLRLLEEALAQRGAMQAVIARPYVRLLAAQAYADAGRWAQAAKWSHVALECTRDGEEKWLDAEVMLTAGDVLVRAGQWSEVDSKQMCLRAREIAAAQGSALFHRRAEAALGAAGAGGGACDPG